MKKIIALAAVAAFIGVIVAGALVPRRGRRTGFFYAMGGIPVGVVAYGRTGGAFEDDLAAASQAVDDLEDILSRHRAHSELARLNRLGTGCLERPSEILTDMMRRSRRWFKASDGAFDVTVGPLIDLWKRSAAKGTMPSSEEVARIREDIGTGRVRLEGGRICLTADNVSIDLGAIAKGAILDRTAAVLQARGVPRGVVDAGGDVIAFGEGLFRIGIRDPSAAERGMLMGSITVPAGAVVTSGSYERFATINGKRVSHIIDPRTGMPAAGPSSVTVMGPRAADADALATAVSVLGRAEGLALVERLDDFDALIVSDGKAWCSSRLCEIVDLVPRWRESLFSY